MNCRSVSQKAFEDISKYRKKRKKQKVNSFNENNTKKNYEQWELSMRDIFSKESYRLNNLLGLHKINKL